jgi:arylsulfatase A-like enzyme
MHGPYLVILGIFLTLVACTEKSGQEPSGAPPNIIFLLTDDHRWDALGAAGNPIIRTPHLDHLAAEGILFQNAYVTTSICAVSRASFLSGQYASRHGINDFNTSFSAQALQQTYPALLRKKGYQLGFVGKYGVGHPDHQPDTLFDYWAATPLHQPKYENVDSNGNYLHYTDIINRDIHGFIEQAGAQPFCLSVSFKAPHVEDSDTIRQFIPNPRFDSLYQQVEIPQPETAAPAYFDRLPPFMRDEHTISRQRWRWRFQDPQQFQQSVKNYYRLISGVDEVVGNLRQQLKDRQLDDNTIIIFMGDNGFFLGEHGLAGKWYGYEESIRVPLIVYDPRNRALLKKSERIALNIDIAPTILELAGIAVPDSMQGQGLLNRQLPARNYFYYEHRTIGAPLIPQTSGLVSTKLKYLYYPEYEYEELFDLQSDPGETNNLAGQAEHQPLLNEMRARHKKWRAKAL